MPSAPTSVYASYAQREALVMGPIMVQLLAALDPLPHMAALLGENAPELRRSSSDTI